MEKLVEFRDSIGDNYGAREYMKRLKSLDPRNKFVEDNYDRIQNGGSGMSGDGLLGFIKSLFRR